MRLSPPNQVHRRHETRGVALIIVLLVVFALTVTAATFAYQMRVETRLATTTSSESELEWLGRSGVEYAKWILSEQQRQPGEQAYNGLNQFWAGGSDSPNPVEDPFAGISLENIQVGQGRISIRIVDEERKFNINQTQPQMLELALNLVGTDAGDNSVIASSILDWIDKDDFPKAGGGAESDFYLRQDPPHLAKNAPIDDITELLKVNGITPELFYGSSFQRSGFLRGGAGFGATSGPDGASSGFGLVDLFCAISTGQVNINTAPEPVLTLALGGDRNTASEVIKLRAGMDGVDGTEDDEPARNPGEIPRLLGPAGATGGQSGARFVTISYTFRVHVSAEFGNARRRYVATIRRGGQSPRDFQTMIFRRE